MRALLGFIVLNAWFAAVGWRLLSSFGLVRAGGWRAALPALGPAFLLGIASLGPLLCVSLVAGVPVTLLTVLGAGGVVLLAAEVVGRRVRPPADRLVPGGVGARERVVRWISRGAGALAGAYAVVGFWAFARAPTRGDDARIWSLRGLTLVYYHVLQPEIFRNGSESGGHPGYPLLQPLFETMLSEAMGRPQLRLYHAELWLLVIAAVCSAAFLIGRGHRRADADRVVWTSALVLLGCTPIFILNVYIGDADITASTMLGVAVLAFARWVDAGSRAELAVGAILLTAAASTKNEDLLAAILVLAVAGVARLLSSRPSLRFGSLLRRPDWLLAAVYFAALILPWRLWLSAHHLTDSVEPPLPRALSPGYVIGRHHLHRVATSMLHEVLQQWGWLAAIFIVTCTTCLLTDVARRVTAFYLVSCTAIVLALVWLYTTTPLSLSYLIRTSMDRTVAVFMVPAAVATAHLLSVLVEQKSTGVGRTR
jgi:hypothetical protein